MKLERFKKTVLPLRNKLIHVALNLLTERADAEDVVQDAFLKLWSMRDRLDSYRNVEALAVTMAKNLTLDLIRKRQSEKDWIAGMTAEKEVERPDKILEQSDTVNCIRQLIEMLPPLQQSIIRMKDVEGYEVSEIAEITGTQAEAVRVNLSRARKKIKEQYRLINREKYGNR
jgi:RNA polymerase sigma-70 factor (ECF subfamily)